MPATAATANPVNPKSAAKPDQLPPSATNAEIPPSATNPEIPAETTNPEIPAEATNPEIPTAAPDPEIRTAATNPVIPTASATNPEIPADPCTQTLRIRSMDTQSTLLRSGTAVTDGPESQVDDPEPCTEWSQSEALRQLIFAHPMQQASASFVSVIEPLDKGMVSLAKVLINHVCLTARLNVSDVMHRLGLPDLSGDDFASWENLFNVFDSGHKSACAMEGSIRDAREHALSAYQLKEQQAEELRHMLAGHLEKKNLSQSTYDYKMKLVKDGLLRFHEESQLELAAKEKDARNHQDQCVNTLILIWEKLPESAKSVLPVSLTERDDVERESDTAVDMFDIDKILDNFLQTDSKPSPDGPGPVKDCSA